VKILVAAPPSSRIAATSLTRASCSGVSLRKGLSNAADFGAQVAHINLTGSSSKGGHRQQRPDQERQTASAGDHHASLFSFLIGALLTVAAFADEPRQVDVGGPGAEVRSIRQPFSFKLTPEQLARVSEVAAIATEGGAATRIFHGRNRKRAGARSQARTGRIDVDALLAKRQGRLSSAVAR